MPTNAQNIFSCSCEHNYGKSFVEFKKHSHSGEPHEWTDGDSFRVLIQPMTDASATLYRLDPDTLTEAEFETLLNNFDGQLSIFSEIRFYCHPAHLHPFHRRLLSDTTLAEKVGMITHLSEIV